MSFGGALDRPGISTAQRDDYRDATRAGSPKHPPIAFLQARLGERQAPQRVRGQRIHAGLIEDDVRLECEDAWKHSVQGAEIFRVARAVFELEVDLAALLAERKI